MPASASPPPANLWWRHSGGPRPPWSGLPGILGRWSLLHSLLLAVALLSGVGMGAVALAYSGYNDYLHQLPDAVTLAAMEPPLDSHVYARDGTTLLATLHDPNFRHEHVNLGDIAAVARKATIDVEDRHFYEESSWDLPRIFKAGYDNATGSGPVQGASTITQQLAKFSFLAASDRSFDRKIKQFLLGDEIDGNFTKDQILEMYLNRIPYGNHAVGIGTAARLYFHKSARDLDLAEASMLAGLPQSPTDYNPLLHGPGDTVNPRAKDRQRTVLDAMVSVGHISGADAERAASEPLDFHSWEDSETQVHPDFLDFLRRYLDSHYGDAYIHPGGWEIYSTLDPARQNASEQVLHDGIKAVRDQFNAHDGSIVSVDPRNGEVVTMVGAWDDGDRDIGQLNMALRPVKPGSTIKVFTYSAAIASRAFTMTTPVLDAPITLPSGQGPYSPSNYDQRFHGVCQVKQCLGNSYNVPAVKVEAATGVPYITNLEIAAGLRSLEDPKNRPAPLDYAATLGGLSFGISPLDLASGAATLAGLGVHHDPTPVLRIVDALGKNNHTHDAKAESRQVIPENAAFIIDEITSNDSNRVAAFGPHSALTLPDRRVSAKTGTSDFFQDNWTVGWTPQLATAVWVGNPQPSCLRNQDRAYMGALLASHPPLYKDQGIDDPYSPADLAHYGLVAANNHCGHLEGATGITGAAPIWNVYMTKALAGVPATWYTKPIDVVERGTGDDGDFYLPGTEPAPPGCTPAGPPTDPTSICAPPPVPVPVSPAGVPTPPPAPVPSPSPAAPSEVPSPAPPTP